MWPTSCRVGPSKTIPGDEIWRHAACNTEGRGHSRHFRSRVSPQRIECDITVHLSPPAPSPEFVWLMDRSTLILTDSGGVQEEAPSLKKPILVMRDTTERPEALDAGAVELVGTEPSRIVESVTRLLRDPAEYARRQIERSPYGDGHAATRIVDLLLTQFRR